MLPLIDDVQIEDEVSAESGPSSPSSVSVETDEDAPEALEWLLSKGKTGRLHIAGDSECLGECGVTRCGRNLRSLEAGQGVEAALATRRKFSPRCYAALGALTRDVFTRAHQVAE